MNSETNTTVAQTIRVKGESGGEEYNFLLTKEQAIAVLEEAWNREVDEQATSDGKAAKQGGVFPALLFSYTANAGRRERAGLSIAGGIVTEQGFQLDKWVAAAFDAPRMTPEQRAAKAKEAAARAKAEAEQAAKLAERVETAKKFGKTLAEQHAEMLWGSEAQDVLALAFPAPAATEAPAESEVPAE